MSKPLKGFITYSHKDTTAKDELRERLAVMEQKNELTTWHDGEITAGDEWYEDISKNLAEADILLYLVSAASLASKNCNKEVAEALTTDIKVIPIILEHCDWMQHQLSDFEVLPLKGKPISKWEDPSAGWQNVVDGVRKAVSEIQSQEKSSSECTQNRQLAEWVFQQGNFLMMIGQNGRAIEAYSYAVNLNPQNANAYSNRGIAYGNKGDFDNAIRDHNAAIKLNPCESDFYTNRGATYVDQGDLDNAIKDYNMAIQLDSHSTEAYYNRGIAYAAKDVVDKAIIDYDAAIKLNPRHAEAYNNRGIAYGRKNRLDNAIQDFNMAIQTNPCHTEAYYNRGIAYANKNDFDNAIADYTIAIKLRPDSIDPYYNRGIAYFNKGEFNNAIADYTTAARINPRHASTYYNRGNAYLTKGDFEKAVTDYTMAIELNRCDAKAYNNRGIAYSQKREFDLAITDYNTAIELNPQFAPSHYNRGEAWLRQKEWDKAKTDFKTAKLLGVDITAMFHNSYKDVETYQKNRLVKLPEDLALLLTQRRRDRYPKLQKVLDADGNPLESPDVVNLRDQLRNAGPPLSEYINAKSAFGINTTPTEVFVVNKATRVELIADHPSSSDILIPYLHGQDIRRWYVDTPQQWLIFTHRGIVIDDYPAILKYLENHKGKLQKRKGKQAWYELPTSHRDVGRFERPKLVCPNTYNHQTFAVDTAGYYYGNTSYLIPTEETWLCGLLNSRTVEWFYSQVSNQLTIDPLRARSGYIRQIPIPDITPVHKALIAKVVDYLIYLQQQPEINSKDLKHARDRIMLGYFERVIDGLVYEAYQPAELHKSDKVFLQPLLDEQLPLIEEIQRDKMSALRDIFELLYERTHLIRRNLYYLDSVKSVRIIEGKL